MGPQGKPVSRNAIIRELLADAPSTANEIAALTDLPIAGVSDSVEQLCRLGHIRNTGRYVGHPMQVLYEITGKGMRLI